MRFVRGVLVSAAIVVCAPSVLHAQTLVWDPSPDPAVTGYRVFYGTQSGVYPNQLDVGNVVLYQPPSGFDWSITRYFVVLAYTSSGSTSSFSNEVQWVPDVPTKITSLQANVSYPLLVRRSVTWTATATASSPLEYRFWLYRQTGWTMVQDYSASNTFTWTPTQGDVGQPYAVQVWARAVGSSAQYESWLGTPTFAVTVLPFELSADVDFPTPPGNQVTWTATVAAASTSTLEYRFLVKDQNSTNWTVFREYATSNVAQWTPAATGTYAIQGWARRVGSTAQYEYAGTTDFFTVSQSPLSVTSLTTDVPSPAITGTTIKWTARVMGGFSGPIQYQFRLYSPTAGWNVVQPYGPSETYTWTPAWGSEGDYAVEVWVRSNGSTANYESSRVSGTFTIQRASMRLTTDTLFPVAPGSAVDWKADVPDPTANLEYEFWLYSVATATWSLGKPYGVDQTFRWIPASTGSYFIQAWARRVGSSVAYEVYRSTNQLQVSQGPAQVVSLTSNVSLPATSGTTITWTAGANGGTAGPLQYQFWRWGSNGWVLAQDYSALNSYSWTPTASDVGDHAVQVWVRSAGSSASYESYKSTGIFSIN
jgi:hypothetical protein